MKINNTLEVPRIVCEHWGILTGEVTPIIRKKESIKPAVGKRIASKLISLEVSPPIIKEPIIRSSSLNWLFPIIRRLDGWGYESLQLYLSVS